VNQQSGAESPEYSNALAQFSLNLLPQKKWADAEPILRECLAIRRKTQPDDWRTFNTASQLGEALLGQKNSTNHSVEAGLLKTWPEGGPPVAWKVEGLGHGVASVAVSGGRVASLGYRDEQEFVSALDEASGRLLWRSAIGPDVKERGVMRFLGQRTPTFDGDRLYVVTARAVLICLSTADGRERWRKDMVAEFGAKIGRWGFCDYPLVDGERLICTPAGDKAAMVALDKRTGAVAWRAEVPDAGPNAYSGVVAAELCGVRQYVNFLQGGILSVAADDGRVLWRYAGHPSTAGNSHNLVVLDDGVFSANGMYAGVVRLRVLRRGQDLTVEVAYRSTTRFQSWFGTAIRVRDHTVTLGPDGPQAVDLAGGLCVWKGPLLRPRPRTGSDLAAMTMAEGRLILRYRDGEVLLAEITPTGVQKKGSFKGPNTDRELAWTMPVVTGGRLYLRDHDRLFCYDVREPRRKARATATVFTPTPQDVVEKLLELAEVKRTDRVYDLGCGDGRIVVTAARRYGAAAVGIDLDFECVRRSIENMKRSRVDHLVRIEQGDLFETDLCDADVIALFLTAGVNERLRPRLEKLKLGARVVAHHFPIPGVKPDRTIEVVSAETGEKHEVFLWRAPMKENAKPTGGAPR
jgi:outer membrane protein assembly factor BamB